jgi:hypothetical protein
MMSRPVMGPTYSKSTGGSFPGGKAAGAWGWPLTCDQCRSQEYLNLYIPLPRSLRGVFLYWLSTGTILRLTRQNFGSAGITRNLLTASDEGMNIVWMASVSPLILTSKLFLQLTKFSPFALSVLPLLPLSLFLSSQISKPSHVPSVMKITSCDKLSLN